LRIGSAGKTFSATGWKIGYITAAPPLLAAAAKAHQFVTFTTAPNLQRAAAYGLGKDASYFRNLAATQQAKRDRLSAGLRNIGFKVLAGEGSYFLTVDIRSVGFDDTDSDFCRHITTEAGVAAVPVSVFYLDGKPDHFARFCFCKRNSILDEACARLGRHFRYRGVAAGS
jgi:aspartate/methionine/tyrosine aminotransferase